MNYITPKSLQKGDTIGIITPSSPLMPGRLESGIPYLEHLGFKVKIGNYNSNSDRFLAGRDEDRAKDIMYFFKDPAVKALIATGGGYGSQRVLPFLDYDAIRAHPKILAGFSDTTALQLGLLKKANLVTYTGFTLADADDGQVNSLVEKNLLSCLMGESYSVTGGSTIHSGVASGPLMGGNLMCLLALMGTPYQPDFNGSILLLEDVWDEPYKIDSKMSQLNLAGVFDQVAGVIFGPFVNCIAKHFPE